jgi:cellobiose-specific phosphotransferase system component IIA
VIAASIFLAVLLALSVAAVGLYYVRGLDSHSKAERVRMDLEVAEAEQEVAEAKAALNKEMAKPTELIAQLSPEGINEQMALLEQAQDNLKRKSNHLKLLKEAQTKLK